MEQPVEMSIWQVFVENWHDIRAGEGGFGNCQQLTLLKAMKWMTSPQERV